ncbi:MAG: integrase core domain-containing protein [Acidobacteriaceae bacterium]
MDPCTRRIIGFAVRVGDVDGPVLGWMFSHAVSQMGTPKYLSSDNDPLVTFYRWRAHLRIPGIEKLKSIPDVPRSHPVIERLIGTLRREVLDQVLFWSASDLEKTR